MSTSRLERLLIGLLFFQSAVCSAQSRQAQPKSVVVQSTGSITAEPSTVVPKLQSVPANPPSVASTSSATVTPSTSAPNLTGAELADSFAQPGMEAQVLLTGPVFDSKMKVGVNDNIGDAVPIQVEDTTHASAYLKLNWTAPTDPSQAPTPNITITLFDDSGNNTYHRRLTTHLVPKKQVDEANSGSFISRVELARYADRTRKAAAARNKVATAQRTFDNSGKVSAYSGDIATLGSGPRNSTPDLYCRADSPAESTYIRVRRSVMDPKEASDAFGRRLGRHFIIFQVTVENDNTDYQYMLHDVSIDVSQLYGQPLGTYQWAFSTQELSMLRGVPEKGADYDPRNMTFHILRSVGTVAGGATGLVADSIQDVFGGAVAAYNGPLLSSFTDIFPDHTATQLNRLSDSAFISNTIVDKQGAKVFAIFVPASLLLTNQESTEFWRNPQQLMQQSVHDFRRADVCVDGAFITQVPSLSLSSIAFADPTKAQPNATVDLKLVGGNLVAGDTQLAIFSQNVALSSVSSDKTTATATLTLPATYNPLLQYDAYLISSKAGTKSTSVQLPASPNPVLASVVFDDPAKAGPGKTVQLDLKGQNFVAGDTDFVGLGGIDQPLVPGPDGTTATVQITLPTDKTVYDPAKAWPVSLTSKVGYKSATGILPATVLTLTKAVVAAGAQGGADGTTPVTLTGTGLFLPSITISIDGALAPSTLKNVSIDGTAATIAFPLASGTTYSGVHKIHLGSGAVTTADVTINQ